MSTARVEKLLSQLKTDPAAVVELYPLLTKIDYYVLVGRMRGVSLENALFLTYSSREFSELPAFTSDRYPLLEQLRRQSEAEAMLVPGLELFRQLKDRNIIAHEGDTQLAINPGWEHGIRVSRAILLSALSAN
jgi:hypothetical protein